MTASATYIIPTMNLQTKSSAKIMFHAKQIGKNNQFLEMESCLPGLHCYTSIFPVLRKHPLGPPRYIHLRGEVREVFVWCQCTLLCHGHDFAKAFLFVLWWEADGKEARKIWLYINVYNLWFYEYIYIYVYAIDEYDWICIIYEYIICLYM